MVIVKCLGGLGNQMCQFAYYQELIARGYRVRFDISGFNQYKVHHYCLDKVFKLQINYANYWQRCFYTSLLGRVVRKLLRWCGYQDNYIVQQDLYFDERYVVNLNHNCYMDGYWHSEKYFINVADKVRQSFTFPQLTGLNQQIAEKIKSSLSVSMHVRRGDYVGHSLYDNICNQDYYNRALDYLTDKIGTKFSLFIFSNDIAWCKENFDYPDITFVSNNHGDASYIDMQLMSMCRHNILANSSFSWWAAWLNQNADKLVLVPKKFFNNNAYNEQDLYPYSWIKL
jgi:hypothetical protein